MLQSERKANSVIHHNNQQVNPDNLLVVMLMNGVGCSMPLHLAAAVKVNVLFADARMHPH